MMNVTMICRTSSIVSPFTSEPRNGINGSFESKTMVYSVACDRGYAITSTVNGQQVKKQAVDFWLVRFNGNQAELMNQYATAVNQEGKLISRHLALFGRFEKYQSNKPIKVKSITLMGDTVATDPNTTTAVPAYPESVIFVVTNVQFLDANPNGNNASTTPVSSSSQADLLARLKNNAPQAQNTQQPAQAMPGVPTPDAGNTITASSLPKVETPVSVSGSQSATNTMLNATMEGVAQEMQNGAAGVAASVAAQNNVKMPSAPTVPAGFQPGNDVPF